MGQIVVGVDGSENSHRALQWAADEARLRGSTVLVVHSWSFPVLHLRRSELDAIPSADLAGAAERLVGEAVASLADTGGVEVRREVANEPAAQALLRASEGAELLVVGSRGTGGFAGLLLGSVSMQCAQHATCPVVIVH